MSTGRHLHRGRAPAGSSTVTGTDTADGASGPWSPFTRGPVTIESTSQTITFPPVADTPLSAGTKTVSATATSGLTVTFSSTTGSVCTVSGTTVSLVALGTCTIQADQAGDSTYDPAPPVTNSFQITKDQQTITWTATPDTALSAGSVTVAATASSGLAVTYTSSTTSVCTVSGSTATLLTAGTCTLTAAQPGDSTYDPAPSVDDSFQVTKTPQTITFTPPADTPIAAGTVSVSATAGSGLTVAFSSVDTSVCTVSGNTVTLLSGGTCTLHADQPGDATYAAAPTVTGAFQVLKTSQTIAFTPPADQAYTTTPTPVNASADSGLSVVFTSVAPTVCTVTGTSVTLVGVGTCTLHADQPGNGTYAAAAQVAGSFQVSQGVQTITFTAPADRALSDGPLTATATATSGLTVTLSSVDTSICTVSGLTVTPVAAGTCTLHADQPGDTTWSAATQVSRSFTINPAVQTITITPPGNQALSASPLTVSATATSGLAVAFSTATPTICTVTGTTVALLATGSCTLHADQAGNANWAAAPQADVSFSVTANTQTITFTPPADTALSAGPVTVTATSGLPVTFTTATPTVCTVTAASVTLLAAGTCTINADQTGDNQYAAAVQVPGTFTITPGSQTLTLPTPPDRPYSSTPFTVTTATSSALPVALTSATPAVCTVTGTSVTTLTAGTCTLHADQPGDANWLAAPQATATFTITPATQTLTITAPTATALSAGPVTLTATTTSGLTVTFTTTTPSTCTATGNTITLLATGTCNLAANQAGDARYSAATPATATFTVLQDPAPITLPADTPPTPDGTLTGNTAGATATAPGTPITLTGNGYKPHTTITIAVYSTQQNLTTTTTDGTGAFSITITLPTTLAAGTHTLVAAGLAPDNTVRYLTETLAVTTTNTTALPVTGDPTAPTALLGATILTLGAGLTLLTSRRRPRRGRHISGMH